MDNNILQLGLPPLLEKNANSAGFLQDFCRPQDVKLAVPSNILGAYLPCFIDVVFLGLAFFVMAALAILRLRLLKRNIMRPRPYPLEYVAFISALICVLGPSSQLLAQIYVNFRGDEVFPPFELWNRGFAIVAWSLIACVVRKEMYATSRKGWWYTRFAVLFVLAGQLAKLQFTLILLEDFKGWLYFVSYCTFILECLGHVVLGELALFYYPDMGELDAEEEAREEKWRQEAVAEHVLLTGGNDSVCPELQSGFISRLLFNWVWPVIRQGAMRPLNDSDLWQMHPSDCSDICSQELKVALEEELPRGKRMVLRALHKVLGRRFWIAGCFQLVCTFTQFIGPVMLSTLLGSMAKGNPVLISYGYATIILIGTTVGSVCSALYAYHVQRVGLKMRTALIAVLMRKGLHLSHAGRQGFPPARIVGTMQGPVGMLQFMVDSLHSLWSTPLSLIIGVVLLYQLMGPAGLFTGIIYVIAVPLQVCVALRAPTLVQKGMACSKQRLGFLTEVLSHMEPVKCFGWEGGFRYRTNKLRSQELNWARRSLIANSAIFFALEITPIIVTVGTLSAFLILGGTFTTPLLFAAIAYMATIRIPMGSFSDLILNVMGAIESLEAIRELLVAEETSLAPLVPSAPDEPAIECHGGSFSWDPLANHPTLSNISLKIMPGTLTAIVGATGQGKSSLVNAILGELPVASGVKSSGSLKAPVIRGRVAYVPQETWLFHSTIRENILFGQPLDKSRYDRALRVSSAENDLQRLPDGDQTVVYERGSNLSGGQKQRISIARAVYADADVYIFDDPLSALNPESMHQIFFTCIKTALADKTRVLVTNQLHHLPEVDWVILLEEGRVVDQGTFEDLMHRKKHFHELIRSTGAAETPSSAKREDPNDAKHRKQSIGHKWRRWLRIYRLLQVNKTGKDMEEEDETPLFLPPQEEQRSSGKFNFKVLKKYVAFMGGTPVLAFSLLTYLATEGTRVAGSLWLMAWSQGSRSPRYYIGGFAALQVAQSLCFLCSVLWLVLISLWAAKGLHEKMLDAVLGAPLSFFQMTPLGRIMNRFDKDVESSDKILATILSMFLSSFFMVLSTFAFVGCLNPLSLPVLAPLLLLFSAIYVYFQRTSREVERLEASAWTPVIAQWGETLGGLQTLRSFRGHDRMLRINGQAVDRYMRYGLLKAATQCWLQLRLDFVGALMIYGIAVLIITDTAGDQASKASQLGLVLIYAFQITSILPLVLKFASLAENNVNSVERIIQYAELSQEVPPGTEPETPPLGWPDVGAIEFQHCNMRYRPEAPLVLKDLTFSVEGGQRVGIVGRVGAGKSSIFKALFRLTELESGKIVIDDCDLAKLAMKEVRQALMIIPQSSVVFSGTIRFNLDPFEERSDSELWEALRRAHLKDVVRLLPLGLYEELSQASGILSVGQRQLLSLARALVRRSRILVLDEATAALDRGTDALLQKTVREEFVRCTVIVIAHRLATIIDSDKILVLEQGQVTEYDKPANLLDKKDGHFHKMVDSLGETTAKHLKKIAKGEHHLEMDLNRAAAHRLRSWHKVVKGARFGLQSAIPTPVVKDTEIDEQQQKEERAAAQYKVDMVMLEELEQERVEKEKTLLQQGDSAAGPSLNNQEVEEQVPEQQVDAEADTQEERLVGESMWDQEEEEEEEEEEVRGPRVLEKVQEAAEMLAAVLAGEVQGEIDLELEQTGMAPEKWWEAFYGRVEGLAAMGRKAQERVRKLPPTFGALTRLGSQGGFVWGSAGVSFKQRSGF